MAGPVVHFGDIGMAGRADFVSRIDERLGCDDINCGGAIMTQSAESLGDKIMAGANQTADQDDENDRKAVQLLGHVVAVPSYDLAGTRLYPLCLTGPAPYTP